MLDRLRVSVSETDIPLPGGGSLRVTFSGGIVSLTESSDWRVALTRADEGLYQSKQGGRNRVTELRMQDDA